MFILKCSCTSNSISCPGLLSCGCNMCMFESVWLFCMNNLLADSTGVQTKILTHIFFSFFFHNFNSGSWPVSSTAACGRARERPSAPPKRPLQPGWREVTSQIRWATRSSTSGWGSPHSQNRRHRGTCAEPQRWLSVYGPGLCRGGRTQKHIRCRIHSDVFNPHVWVKHLNTSSATVFIKTNQSN